LTPGTQVSIPYLSFTIAFDVEQGFRRGKAQ
jgi:hypothetical protein